MSRLIWSVKRYPVVAITLAVGALGLVLFLLGFVEVTQWLVSGFALLVAAMQAWEMIRDLLRGSWGIDALAIMAIVATVLVGEFWASLVIVLMLSGGEALEDFAANRARRELSSLLSRVPQIAHRLANDGAVDDVAVAEVAIGDVLLVRPAELVPVDGTLLTEAGSFDESSLTGESLPVERFAGDRLLSGSVNEQRAVTMTVTALASDSQYQRIVALVEDAAGSRAPLVRLADRYAVPFTVGSLLVAGIAWWVSGDPVRFAEVLVVATPCPLLIAAPVAFMGGMSRAARQGIIVKSGGTLEQLSSAKTIAFDKTGTLTYGEPTLSALMPVGLSEDELLTLVASAEQYSSHVLARSLVLAAQERGLDLRPATQASEEATNGVAAVIDGRKVVVGKFRFVSEHAPDAVRQSLRGGQLAAYVALDGRFAGAVVLSDKLRANAAETVRRLHSLGVRKSLILTGDAVETAEHVARELGLDDVRADLLPQDKVEAIRALPNRPVIMVGDGVNDAPVLAAADVGIAMGARGSTAASESADVVILVDDVSRAADAVEIGRQTTTIALQSIWLGIALSAGLMGVAAFGLLPAIVGAAMQEVVDLATILLALRAIGRRGRRRRKIESVPQMMGN